jgi:Zn-dependent peptidase ImmA (M78 family)/DNA-binding XRE family transcriptional regulator
MLSDSVPTDPASLGANIVHARKRAGITQAALAESIGMSRPTLVAIEAGQKRPSEVQLNAIAIATKTSVRDLLSLGPPDAALAVRFSALRGAGEVQSAIDSLEDYARRYARLEQLANDKIVRREPPAFPFERIVNVERAAEELASTERLRLGLGDGPLPDLRIIFEEDAGLRIFGLVELRQSRVSGMFSYSQEYGPVVGFNIAQDSRRIRWTLCHEYAHYLTARFEPEITVEPDAAPLRKDRREIFADAFAARFLMPATGLSRRFSEMLSDAGGELRVAHLVLLAKFFQVSFQAITQRLEEIGRVHRGTYEKLKERGFKAREAEATLGIDRHEEPIDRLPFRYVFLVTTLYAKGAISEGDVAAFLHTTRLEAREILQRVPEPGGGARSEAGLDTPVEAVG